MKTNPVRLAILVAASVSILSQPLSAQSSYGSIVGTITDSTGAIVPGAAVTLTNLGTSESRAAKSDAAGDYQFVNLLPGDYRIDIEETGFKHLTRRVEVAVLVATRVDAAMEVGQVGETVEVTSQAPLLQTESASVGQVVEGRTVLETPLNGRNVMNLIELTPGVVAHGQTQGQNFRTGFTNYQIAGGQTGQGKTLLDGVDIMTGLNNNQAFIPMQDTIQEFQVLSNNLPPEFGGTENGVVVLATKSGTNQYHGTAYEFLRNTVLNASTFFSNKAGLPTTAFNQNQFGLNGGGPIKRNKTFIFMAWEEWIQHYGTTTTFTVPTAAERAGNFSTLGNSSGAPTIIYDPANPCTTCPAGQQRTPFPGNIIPADRLNKAAAIMEQYWPLPNLPGAPFTYANNFIVNYVTPSSRNWEFLRMDQNVGSKQRMFGSFNRWNAKLPGVDPYSLGITSVYTQNAHSGMLADTYTFNPTTVMDLRMAYTRHELTRTPTTLGFDNTTLGWPASYNQQLLVSALPTITPNGYSVSDGGQLSTGSQQNIINRQFAGDGYLAGSVTKIVGRHTIKFGANYEWLPTANASLTSQNFNFNNNFTAANPLSPGNTGNSFASFLLGLGSSGTYGNLQRPYNTQRNSGMYVGDTFRVSNRLTLNLGVRWEYAGYWSERHNLANVFLPGATNPVLSAAGLNNRGDAVLVDSPQYSYRTQMIPHWDMFSPRAGAAYRLKESTVVRLGFGTSFAPGSVIGTSASSPVNSAKTTWVPTQNNGLTPVATFSNPFPNGIAQVPGRTPSYYSSELGQSIVVPIPEQPTPYVMNWNVAIQRQLGTTGMIEIDYVGARAVHQLAESAAGNGPNLSQLPDRYDSLGSQLLTPVANPFYGLVQGGTLSQPTVPYGQLLLPYSQYTGVFSPSTAGFDALYHSLQAKFRHRFQQGGSISVSYAWSKNTGNAEAIAGSSTEPSPVGTVQDYTNWSAEKSLMSYNAAQLLVVSYVVDLPIGKGRRFLTNVSGVTDKLVSGWGVSGITTLQSGYPVALTAQPTTLSANFGAGTPRPNVSAGCSKIPDGSAQSRINGWFNTACFSAPNTFGFGSEARTDPNIRQAGIANYDFALFKNTHVTERFVLQFRAEAFNLFNRVQFGPPGQQFGTPTFGVVTTQTNNQRLLQMGLRLSF